MNRRRHLPDLHAPLPAALPPEGTITFTPDHRNVEHILRARFVNYRKGSTWPNAFHDLLGAGIFNSDARSGAASGRPPPRSSLPEPSAPTRRSGGMIPILDAAAAEGSGGAVDFQDLLLRLTFDNICGLALGRDPETLAPRPAGDRLCRRLRPRHRSHAAAVHLAGAGAAAEDVARPRDGGNPNPLCPVRYKIFE
ncbi:Cytochrome P450 86A2 [Apostasia shenzhenica]|uniref:Cytochrome P450 86A2 n=1 Tax=Apostasia shenzhenica TaxID=1088818 RepID=A0A2I0AHN7_9ASPA|nr:Cytochrome P450 86A2 [Apostasia shenzhenica]